MVKAYIEDIEWTVFDSKLSFIRDEDRRSLYEYRKQNIKITTIAWITKQPVIDSCYTVYNPKTFFLIHLN